MKILYVDVTSPIGHINYNHKLLNILSELCEIDIACKEDHLFALKNKGIKVNKSYIIPEEFFPEHIAKSYKNLILYKILYRYNLYKSMKWVHNLVETINYDLVLFSSIEVISFCLSTLRIKTRYVFIDHAITDIDKNNIKKLFWKLINKNIEAIAMEEYIGKFLKNKIRIKNKVWLVNHPLPKIEIEKLQKAQTNKKIVFAPSGSNDEEFTSFLIENHQMIKNYKVIIKSKKRYFKANNLEVFNTRLENEEYYGLMAACDYVLFPYNCDYNYRVSGVLYEAVMLNKKCLINGNNSLKYYAEKYPQMVTQFNGYDDFINLLAFLEDKDYMKELALIKSVYSDDNIKQQLKQMLTNKGQVLNGE